MKTEKVLSYLLAFLLFSGCVSYAAGEQYEEIDTNRKCTLTIQIPGESETDPLAKEVFTATVYRFAEINKDADITLLPFYKNIAEDINSLKPHNEDMLKELPNTISQIIIANNIPEDAMITIQDGKGTVTELQQGLYCIIPEQKINTGSEVYVLAPFIVSLPNGQHNADPYWQYEITVTMKYGKTEPTGTAMITKRILSCAALTGGANAYFRITGVLPIYDTHGTEIGSRKVYNNVFALHFNEPGEKTIEITDIPVGTVLTTTEIQTDADYTLAPGSAATQQVIITEETPAEVLFENEYSNGLVYSANIVNSFEYSGAGQYNHTKSHEAPSPKQETGEE